MFKIPLVILLLSITLLAENPKLFNSLGDPIYNSQDKIEKLVDIPAFQENVTYINLYLKEVDRVWAEGMRADGVNNPELKKGYLKELRVLSKDYANIMRSVKKRFNRAMERRDIDTFADIVNSGLIPVGRENPEALKFYKEFVRESVKIDSIEEYLDSIRPKPRKKVVTKMGPSKAERIAQREREKELKRKAEAERLEKEKREEAKRLLQEAL